ncbi:THO complex subunit 5 homolog [Bradysia coprophila]|uniref:THO complex subunit 5 homolog n=1 Tax=Bradysia coprophila TaxID=38358 RepID=UPI00187DD4B3|nr:THO complex subunit 5 homolog [Bradysia coprophila]
MVNTKSKEKEKESERDSNDKKRRKSDSTVTKIPKEDVYASVVQFEEQESQHRPAEKDAELFHSTCSELRKLFEEINKLKKLKTEKARLEINEKRIEASFLFVLLKKLNRLDKVRLRTGRDDLHNEKQIVDSNRLQLQNLFYESEHLNKEVQRCYQFKSEDEEIDLISEEEFYAQAPENIAQSGKTSNDEHARRLARLSWELQQRKELAAMCKELEKQKELVAQDNETKTNLRDSLKPRLEALLKSTKPLQEALNMNFEEDWKVQKIASLLPRPLYLVYANLCAYSEACDNQLSVTINGDEIDAKNLEEIDKFNSKIDLDDVPDSDNDDNDGENDRPSKGHHHRRKNKDVLLEQKKDNLFKVHPLSVSLRIKSKINDTVLCVTLYYLPTLNFVTSLCKLEPENAAGVSEVLNPASILNALSPGDYGEESVNPKTYYQLKEQSIDDFMVILREKMLGKPYRWAQDLCGLEFLNTASTSTTNYSSISNEFVQLSVPKIVKQIRSRWQARLMLNSQISALENKSFTSTSLNQKAARISSSLLQWTAITWEEYCSSLSTKRFVDANVITSHDLLYRAVITRGSAKLECFVGINANYPTEMPLSALELSWNGRHNADSSAAIRDLEAWVNLIDDPKNTSNVLELQIHRALSSLDIYLETEGTLINSSEFQATKTFLKAFRDRTHSRPYKMMENSGSVVYTQI